MKFFDFYGKLHLAVSGCAADSLCKIFPNNLIRRPIVSSKSITIEESDIKPKGLKVEKALAFDGKHLYVHDKKGHWLKFDMGKNQLPQQISYSQGFDQLRLSKIVEWIMHLHLSLYRIAFVHCMGFVYQKKARLAIAWKSTGKTRAFLDLWVRNFPMLGDDWCAVDEDGLVRPYLKAAFVYKLDLLSAPFKVLKRLSPLGRLSIPIYRGLLRMGRSGTLLEHKVSSLWSSLRFPMLLDFIQQGVGSMDVLPIDKCFLINRYYNEQNILTIKSVDKATAHQKLGKIYRYELSQFLDERILDFAIGDLNPVGDHMSRVVSIYEKMLKLCTFCEIALSTNLTEGDLVRELTQ